MFDNSLVCDVSKCLCVMCLVTPICDGILGGLGQYGTAIGFRYSYFLLFGWRPELEKQAFRDNIINLNLSSWVYNFKIEKYRQHNTTAHKFIVDISVKKL